MAQAAMIGATQAATTKAVVESGGGRTYLVGRPESLQIESIGHHSEASMQV